MSQLVKSKIHTIIKSDYFPFVVNFFFLVLLFSRCILRANTDDTYYRDALNNLSIFEWVYQRALTWQPRLSSDFSLALINFNLPVWSILNALMVTISLFVICKLASINFINDNYKKYFHIIICCSFYLIYPYVINSATFWYTGSFHYLWPITAMLVAIIPYYYAVVGRSLIYKNIYLISIFASIYASYTEQTIAVQICFYTLCLLFMIIKKMKISKYLITQFVLVVVNSIFFFLLSMISDRKAQEMHWYPEYPMLTSIDKVFQGVNWTNYHYLISSNLLMLILMILLFTLIWVRNKGIIKYLSIIPLLYEIGVIIPFDVIFKNININNKHSVEYLGTKSTYSIEQVLERVFYDFFNTSPSNIKTSWSDLLPAFFGTFIILYILVLLYIAIEDNHMKFISILLYLAMLASGYIISFSPTIFASGVRIFLLGDIFIIFLIGILLYNCLQKVNIQSTKTLRILKISFITIVIISLIMYIQLFASFVTFYGIL